MVIYKETDAVIEVKMYHIHKIGGKLHRGFCTDNGDIPVANFNKTTGKIEDVVNTRGNAYAHRNAKRFRNSNNG